MSSTQSSEPVPLHEIPRGSYVQVSTATWLRLESWTVLDKSTRPDAARYMVAFAGVAQASMFHSEPSWPVWTGDEPPRTSGVAS